MRCSQPRRNGGFTLLEILVVAGLIGLVMTIGTSTFVNVTRAWDERRAITDLDGQARAALESIRQDVSSTLSSEVSGLVLSGSSRTVTDDRSYPAATHADDDLVLAIESMDGIRGAATPMKVAYRVERSGAGGTLVRTTGGLSAEFPTGAPLDVITARVQGFSVEYLGRGPGAVWSETWAGPGMPGALRVSIALEHPVRTEFQVARKAVFPIHVE